MRSGYLFGVWYFRGYSGATRLRWGWGDRRCGVSTWDVVYFSFLGWRRHRDGLGRDGTGHTGARDYDGDGKADITVYRVGTWYILRSSDGVQTAVGWGTVGDIPLN